MPVALKAPGKDADRVLPDKTAADNRFVALDQIIYFSGKIAEAQKVQKAATKVVRTLRKQFDNTGVSMEIFDVMTKLRAKDNPEKAIAAFIDELLHFGKAFALVPKGTQVDFFTGGGNAADANDKAFMTGRIRGLMGLSPDDQAYSPESDLGQEHLRGWHEGQRVLAEQFQAHNEAMAAEEKQKAEKAEALAKKKAEKAAKSVPKTDTGETVN